MTHGGRVLRMAEFTHLTLVSVEEGLWLIMERVFIFFLVRIDARLIAFSYFLSFTFMDKDMKNHREAMAFPSTDSSIRSN